MIKLIEELSQANIGIVLNGNDLEINFDDQIDELLLAKIKTNKSEIIAFLKSHGTTKSFLDISPLAQSKNYALSNGQKQLWVLSQFEGSAIAYNLPNSVELQGVYDKDIFEKAVNKVIARHEILRTIFKEDDNEEVRQWVIDPSDFNFSIDFIDFRNQDDPIQKVKNYIDNDSYQPYNLEEGPLLRASLIQLDEEHYYFYYNMHHIISDGWSIDVLIKDVIFYYEAIKNKSNAELPELRIQYKDYAAWQLQQLKEEEFKNHREFWAENLSGELTLLNLPSEKSRPKIFTGNGRSLGTFISSEATQALTNYCQANGASTFMGILAVWNVLFHKYTGESDIIIGSPTAGRNHKDLEDQIGFYVNTLVHRNNVSADQSFNEFFETLKKKTLTSFNHQMYPFDVLVEDLSVNRDISRNVIFDVMLTLQNAGGDEETGWVDSSQFGVIKDGGFSGAKFDLDIDFQEIDGSLLMRIVYNSDIYASTMIEGMMGHYVNLLEALVSNPNQRIGDTSFINASEKERLLEGLNSTSVATTWSTSFVDLFKTQVTSSPESIAVRSSVTQLSYQELDELSNKLCHYLVDRFGLEKSDYAVINIERDEWLPICILALFKLGCAYIPIDPSYPEDRKQYILEDSCCDTIIDANLISSFLSESAAISSSYEPRELAPSDLAYVIYTSGSTGNPKGVMIEHQGMMNHLYAMAEDLQLDSDSVIVQNAPYTFDISVWQLLNSLIVGGTTSIYNSETILDPQLFLKRIKDEGATVLQVVPSYLNALLDADLGMSVPVLGNLSYLSVTGEAVNKELVERWFSNYNGVPMVNAYGPAEASDDVTLHIMTEVPSGTTVPVGQPIRNMQVYILDENLNLCASGVTGELCVSGIGLAKGYLNRPKLTKEKFVSHPFKEGERLYRTGDLGRWSIDGTIEFMGRKDSQVKIRGHRIELGEIEYHLQENEAVDTAVVTAVEDLSNQTSLVAYIVTNKEIKSNDLRDYLAGCIPGFMLPTFYIELDELPLTPNGKVDVKALPHPNEVGASNKEEYMAPKTPSEKALVTVCEKVLKREKIGVAENFFNLGGDSIKSIQVVSGLRQLGFKLSVNDILRYPRLSDLAKLVTTKVREIDQAAVEGKALLTPIQHSFFQDELIGNRNHYNQSVTLKSTTEVDTVQLENCVAYLVKHHDALRMQYTSEGGYWQQTNRDFSEDCYSVNFYDLRSSNSEKEEVKTIGTQLQSGMDITKGPLVKVAHFRMKDGDYVALIIHHLVVDGVSWRILMEDLSVLYDQIQHGKSMKLPLKTDSFKYWGQKQNDYAQSKKFIKDKAYWEQLSTTSIPSLPTDRLEDLNGALDKTASFRLTKEVTNLVQTKINTVYNTDINDVLLTGLGLAIKDVFGIEKSVLHMEGHGREEFLSETDISRTVGWFTSEFPFVLNVASNKVVNALIQVKESLRKIPTKGIGYGIYRYLTNGIQNQSLKPSVEFNFLGDFGSSASSKEEQGVMFEFASLDIGKDSASVNKDKCKLYVTGMIADDQLELAVGYSDSNYDEKTISELIRSYRNHLLLLVDELSNIESNCLTPSDLTQPLVTMKQLEEISANGDIEDIYKLSPLQLGIYYHWLTDPTSPMYFEQMSYGLKGLDMTTAIVKNAYDELVAAHAILRTSFNNSYGDQTIQIVHDTVASNFRYERVKDNLSETERQAYIEQVKKEDRQEGFNLAKPCQMRLIVLDFGNGNFEFIWSHHHILMDGWCMGIIINEFSQRLMALNSGTSFAIPTPASYANYIKWLDGVDTEESLEFWKTYLSGYTEIAAIPYEEKQTVSSEEYDKSTAEFTVEGKMFNELASLCKELEVTQNTFVQAVWGYLLSRYNNTNDVVFGSIVSGRSADLEGIEEIIGLFINTIPVRVNYDAEQTVKDLLTQLQQTSLEANSHHHIGLSDVQAQSDLGMDLINHTLVFENYPLEEAVVGDKNAKKEEGGFSIESLETHEQMNYNFAMIIYASEQSLTFSFEHNTNKFSAVSVGRMLEHFKSLITSFCKNPESKLANIEVVSKKERTQLVEAFNATAVDYPSNITLLDLFNKQLHENAHKVALEFEGASLTFEELNKKSNQLANYLISSEISEGQLVPICIDRSLEMVIGILGIMKAGGAYVPIDPQYPQDRIDYIINDTAAKLVLTSTAYVENFKEQGVVDLNSFKYDTYSSNAATNDVAPGNLAYCIYTSGTTGNPKGVINRHSGLLNRLFWMRDSLEINSESILIQKTPYVFDVSVWELTMPLITGCKLVIAKPGGHTEPQYLIDTIDANEVSIIHFVPSMLSAFLDFDTSNSLQTMKHVVCSGEALTSAIVDRFKQSLPHVRIHNLYGPTEAAIDVTAIDLTLIDTETEGVSIGKPVANTQLYVVSQSLSVQPLGVPGELLIGGIQVAAGYLNKLELTSKKFIEDIFSRNGHLYRTGDLAKWNYDGSIDFLGRIDSQVKIHGHRIELGEIESVLMHKDTIKDAVVLALESENGEKQLVAYITSEIEEKNEELRAHLMDKVPSYMVPNVYVQLDRIPVTVNGKANKKELRKMASPELNSTTAYVAPRNETEQKLSEIWSEILQIENIGVEDNFFDLGGHSIKAVRMIAKINQAFDMDANIKEIFNHSKISDLALYIDFTLKQKAMKNKKTSVIEIEL